MSKKVEEPLKVSIVGKNVFSSLLLIHQKEQKNLITVHSSDSILDSSKDPRWLVFPAHQSNDLSDFKSVHALNDPLIFHINHRRYPVSQFIQNGPTEVHPAIRKKAVAIALWNDFTPNVWMKKGRRGLEPFSQWPNEVSLSFQEHLSPVLCLVERKQFLNEIETKLASNSIKFLSNEQNVLAVHVPKRHEKFRLHHNAPFEPLEADRVLWTSSLKTLNEEAHSKKKRLKFLKQTAFARWSSFGAWVKPAHVSALPPFSIWLSNENPFFTTAIPTNDMIFRVYCIQYQEKSWLQIQKIKLNHAAGYLEAPKTSQELRLDSFLWKICPFLEKEKIEWSPLALIDEDEVFETPLSLRHHYHPHCHFWNPSFLQSFQEQSERVIAALQ